MTHQARAAGSPSPASRPTARPVQVVVSADVQGTPWSGTAVYRRSLPASYISRQQTETSIRHSRRPRSQFLRDALRRPCIRCGGPKGMEPAAGTFTDTRDSRPLQDGIEDSSSLHPVTIPNCLPRRALVMTLFMLRRVRNCRRYYYYYYYRGSRGEAPRSQKLFSFWTSHSAVFCADHTSFIPISARTDLQIFVLSTYASRLEHSVC